MSRGTNNTPRRRTSTLTPSPAAAIQQVLEGLPARIDAEYDSAYHAARHATEFLGERSDIYMTRELAGMQLRHPELPASSTTHIAFLVILQEHMKDDPTAAHWEPLMRAMVVKQLLTTADSDPRFDAAREIASRLTDAASLIEDGTLTIGDGSQSSPRSFGDQLLEQSSYFWRECRPAMVATLIEDYLSAGAKSQHAHELIAQLRHAGGSWADLAPAGGAWDTSSPQLALRRLRVLAAARYHPDFNKPTPELPESFLQLLNCPASTVAMVESKMALPRMGAVETESALQEQPGLRGRALRRTKGQFKPKVVRSYDEALARVHRAFAEPTLTFGDELRRAQQGDYQPLFNVPASHDTLLQMWEDTGAEAVASVLQDDKGECHITVEEPLNVAGSVGWLRCYAPLRLPSTPAQGSSWNKLAGLLSAANPGLRVPSAKELPDFLATRTLPELLPAVGIPVTAMQMQSDIDMRSVAMQSAPLHQLYAWEQAKAAGRLRDVRELKPCTHTRTKWLLNGPKSTADAVVLHCISCTAHSLDQVPLHRLGPDSLGFDNRAEVAPWMKLSESPLYIHRQRAYDLLEGQADLASRIDQIRARDGEVSLLDRQHAAMQRDLYADSSQPSAPRPAVPRRLRA